MRRVSIVIPTFKEDGIEAAVERLVSYASTLPDTVFELLLVDDSPEDYRAAIRLYIETREAGEKRKRGNEPADPRATRVRLVLGEGRGKGAAIKQGVLASTGEFVFTMDADLPVPLEHIGEFLQRLSEPGVDAVIAERPFRRNLSAPVRFVLSRGLFLFQRGLVFQSTEFRDTQCGFKAFRGDVLRALARRQIVDGGMYDIEYLYMAKLEGRHVAKVNVVPNEETRESKIRVLKSLLLDPLDLVRVKLHGMSGKYRA
jgi:dolichyl-phosphate beta-glucosyltransferase